MDKLKALRNYFEEYLNGGNNIIYVVVVAIIYECIHNAYYI